MRIQLLVESTDPPTGDIQPEGRDPVRFQGWLGLLGVLADLMSSPLPLLPGQSGSELYPGGEPKLAEDVREVGFDRAS